jgi:ankyrin repeat protein
LPKSLDETYQRVLKGINEANQEDAYRLLQCLTVAMRPLRAEELAEVLAIDFDGDEGIPKLNPDWRWEDQEQALQAACSSLITIVNIDGSRVVQFSHFSVKEFLTSRRLAESRGDISCYYVSFTSAHTVLAQACLGVLLWLDHHVNRFTVGKHFPLAQYAARHWVDHAPFGKMSSRVQKGMEHLFDPNKPHFSAWLRLHDIDTPRSLDSTFYMFAPSRKSDATPLYYSALCGLHNLTEHLIAEHPEQVDAHGGYYLTPVVAALARKHFHIAQLLHQHGADVNVRGRRQRTPLHAASEKGHPDIVQWLLNHGADANVRVDFLSWTPVFPAANLGHLEVVRMLVQHNADIKTRDDKGRTPLHVASQYGRLDVVRLLLGHGVDVNARNNDHSTPLHMASEEGKLEVVGLLLGRGANVGAEDGEGRTAYQVASAKGHDKVAKLLSEHGTK